MKSLIKKKINTNILMSWQHDIFFNEIVLHLNMETMYIRELLN